MIATVFQAKPVRQEGIQEKWIAYVAYDHQMNHITTIFPFRSQTVSPGHSNTHRALALMTNVKTLVHQSMGGMAAVSPNRSSEWATNLGMRTTFTWQTFAMQLLL